MNQARDEINAQRNGMEHNLSKAALENARDGVPTVRTLLSPQLFTQ
jgi:hypothetical protein